MGNKSDEPQVITLGSAQRRSIIDEILEETRSHVKETQRQMDAAFTGLDRARTVVLVLLAVACVVCAASLFLSWNAHKHSRASTTGAEKVTLRVDELNLRMNELDAQVVKYNFLIDALSVRIQGNQEAANQLDGRMNNLQASVEASERRLPALTSTLNDVDKRLVAVKSALGDAEPLNQRATVIEDNIRTLQGLVDAISKEIEALKSFIQPAEETPKEDSTD